MRERKVFLVAGLAYGDEGKGSIVDYLVRREKAVAVVRYNGGAQAAHRVVLPDGREHVFAQFGSGTMVPGVQTFLSRFMLVEPYGFFNEYKHLEEIGIKDALGRIVVDENAPVITPYHIAANRILEMSRGEKRFGSCGLGIGETAEDVRELGDDALRVRDLKDRAKTMEKLDLVLRSKHEKLANLKWSFLMLEVWGNLLDSTRLDVIWQTFWDFTKKVRIVESGYLEQLLNKGPVVFEGAQGLLLDPKYGIPPNVTKTDITFNNAMMLLNENNYSGLVRKVGVIRGYFTRHGSGPFPTEDARLTELLPDAANKRHTFQGDFRVGHFNAVDARYALRVLGGVDELAITCLDRLSLVPGLKICNGYKGPEVPRYERFGPVATRQQAMSYAAHLADLIGHNAPPTYSFGPTAFDKVPYFETLITN